MNTILRTEMFDKWLRKLKDTRGKARLLIEFDLLKEAISVTVTQ
jgi:putative component of toxin-antitoxin plasmid stabilization module